MSDLRERVPGHSLIDELLHQWDLGTIRVDDHNSVVIDDEATGWFRGVLGERRVAALLHQLGDEWTVLHSVPVGKGTSDIDHVVIGPPGVFTINTKYSPGKDVWVAGRGMYVGGFSQHYVTNSIGEARRASVLLSRESRMTVPVIGIIVFIDPGEMTYRAAPGGNEHDPEIAVIGDGGLLEALKRRREFSDEQLATIAAAATRPGTWHTRPQPSTAGPHIIREFEALEAAVGPHVGAAAPKPSRQLHRPPVRAVRPARQRYTTSYSRPASRTRSRSGRRKPSLVAELLRAGIMIAGLWIGMQVLLAALAR